MWWRHALVFIFLWLTLSGSACVQMLRPPPPVSPAERLAELQQTMAILQTLQGTQGDPGVKREVESLSDRIRDILAVLRELHGKQMEHDYRLKTLEGGRR